ncbi:MAG: hypothetical protein JSR39_05645 [Verrucomicrobia bacterium]|nr:hypothetical protein [Verrucomicrobiota bacterium]
MPIVFNFLSVFSLLLIPAVSWAHPALEKESADVEQPQVFSYITPPKGWEIANPKFLAKSVQIAFLKKSGSGFCPSINLAVEKSNLSLPEYLNVIRQIHESDKRNRWRQLGKVHTLSGIGQLTEIDTSTEFGPVRMLQLILVKQGYTYVVTAAALKEEIAQHYQEFQSAFRSLQVTSDLISTVPQMERRDTLKERSEQLISTWQNILQQGTTTLLDPGFQKDHWIPFQNSIVQDFEDMGSHWQVLLLKNVQEKMVALIPQVEVHPEAPLQAEEPSAEANSIVADHSVPAIFDDKETLAAEADENSPSENGLELSANEESIVEGSVLVQEDSSSLENTTALPLDPICHAEIADNAEPAFLHDEEALVEPDALITDAEENLHSDHDAAHSIENLAEAVAPAQEGHSFSGDPICHAEEVFPSSSLSSSSPLIEQAIEDRQNTP